MELAEEQRKR